MCRPTIRRSLLSVARVMADLDTGVYTIEIPVVSVMFLLAGLGFFLYLLLTRRTCE